MVAHPFFLFKNWAFQSYGPYSTGSVFINIKTGSLDPVDFTKTRRLLPLLWHNAQSLLAYRAETAAICKGRTYIQWR
jgi:hypothetical protein